MTEDEVILSEGHRSWSRDTPPRSRRDEDRERERYIERQEERRRRFFPDTDRRSRRRHTDHEYRRVDGKRARLPIYVRACSTDGKDGDALAECACDGSKHVMPVFSSLDAREMVARFAAAAKECGIDKDDLAAGLDVTLTRAGLELSPDEPGYRLAERVFRRGDASHPTSRLYAAVEQPHHRDREQQRQSVFHGVIETSVDQDGGATIESLYVRKSQRRRGIGTALVEFVRDRYGCVRVKNVYDSDEARAFWTTIPRKTLLSTN